MAKTGARTKVNIIGGGSAGLFAACFLDPEKFEVTIYDKNKALGRKFLVAGKGGFNLTHAEDSASFIGRYIPKEPLFKAFSTYNNGYFRQWLHDIGIPTYVGTSKRVFPNKGIKPIDVLHAIENKLKRNDVTIVLNHNWQGFSKEQLNTKHEITIFALGGSSWKVTGSDGQWTNYFKAQGIDIVQFEASNCAFQVAWKPELIRLLEGKVIKNASFTCGSKTHKGEAVITTFGIEGSGVYPLSDEVRRALNSGQKAQLFIDLKPDLSAVELLVKLNTGKHKNRKEQLSKTLHLSETALELLKQSTGKEDYLNNAHVVSLIKHFPIEITGLAPIDEAISTVGGIPFHELNANFELNKLPNHYCIGEMVNWDAPTGGYLLQMCFSMGAWVASKINGSEVHP